MEWFNYFDFQEEDDDGDADDDTPEHLRPAPQIDLSSMDTSNPENILKLSKKGRTVMAFVTVSDSPSRLQAEEITKVWQTSLWNANIQAEKWVSFRKLCLWHIFKLYLVIFLFIGIWLMIIERYLCSKTVAKHGKPKTSWSNRSDVKACQWRTKCIQEKEVPIMAKMNFRILNLLNFIFKKTLTSKQIKISSNSLRSIFVIYQKIQIYVKKSFDLCKSKKGKFSPSSIIKPLFFFHWIFCSCIECNIDTIEIIFKIFHHKSKWLLKESSK